jgi:sec-independent protein translocase protein TatB
VFNIGSGELALIAVVALLVLGPRRLPELARGIGKFMREFRRQTDEVRGVVEREFYKMDQELPKADELKLTPRQDTVSHQPVHQALVVDPGHAPDGTLLPDAAPGAADALPAGEAMTSQVTKGMAPSEPVTAGHTAPVGPPQGEKS